MELPTELDLSPLFTSSHNVYVGFEKGRQVLIDVQNRKSDLGLDSSSMELWKIKKNFGQRMDAGLIERNSWLQEVKIYFF